MDLEHLVGVAQSLGFGVRMDASRKSARIEVPRDSGSFLVLRTTQDASGFAVIGSIEVSQGHLAVLARRGPGFCRRATSDLVSYLCLFDIEYELDRFDDLPRMVHVATRWDPESGPRGLLAAIKGVLRPKEGVLHRLRYWVETAADDGGPQRD